MVLGEGAAAVCLEKGRNENALAYITGVGYATEKLKHAVSISAEGLCFQKSMRMAIEAAFGTDQDGQILTFAEMTKKVDAIVMHAPGTIAGDKTEYLAIKKIFGERFPLLTTNRWKIGHTFGASGLLSFETAMRMLQHNEYEEVPFISAQESPQNIKNILVNAVGFGGNAVSILISKA